MSRVVVLGDVMVDVVARLSGPLAAASDAPAAIRFHGGGSAANAAAWLAAAGARPVLIGCVGDDERGRHAHGELRMAGVDRQLERFRILNGLDPKAVVKARDRVKIVVE